MEKKIKLNDADLDPVVGGLDTVPDDIMAAFDRIGEGEFVPREDGIVHPMNPRPEKPAPNPFAKP